MTLEQLNAAASIATLVILAASVFAGVMQLRHMRASNELEAVLSVERNFRLREVQDALSYVQNQLPERLQDPAYRAELSAPGYVDSRRHPEMLLCNWFNGVGSLVAGGFLNEDRFLNAFGRLVDYYWRQLGPVIVLLRRSRGPGQYESFEYLAYRAQQWLRTARADRYPRGGRRLPLGDPWLAVDPPVDASARRA